MNRILNFRKLADNQVNYQGQQITNVYRSADVSFADISDIEELVDLNISDVIDLRSNQEVNQHPQLEDMRIKIKHINVIGNGKQNLVEDFDPKQLLEFMIDLYRNDFVTIEGFKNEFNYILSLNGAPFLFHCTAGKDRTGITGVILMHILGFTKQQIIDEYLIIDQTLVDSIYERFTEHLASEQINDNEVGLRAIASVKIDFINSFYQGIEERYENLDKYIEQKLELTKEDLKQLRNNYLK